MLADDQPTLEQDLLAAPERFAFAQVIDVIEHLAQPARLLGAGTDPGAEALRLRAGFALAFRAGPISWLKAATDQKQAELSVNFFGLGAAQGPLPEPYVELIMEQLRSSGASADFLDMFQHRLLSFVYRSENEFRVAAPFRAPQHSAFMPALAALLGLPPHEEAHQLAPILLAHAGIIVQQRRSMAGFVALLSSHFGVAVTGTEFVGCWTELPDALQTVLGHGGRNDLLGRGAVLGRRAWDQNGAVAIDFAPMPMLLFSALLPEGARHGELAALCAYYLGAQIRCYARLELDALPGYLHQRGADGAAVENPYALGREGCRPGRTAWLAAPAPTLDRAQRQVLLVLNDGREKTE